MIPYTLKTVKEQVIIDLTVVSQLLSRKRNGVSAFSRLLPIFEEEWPQLYSEITVGIESEAHDGVRSAAHKLKGSASVLGAARVKELCAAIIEQALDANLPSPAELDVLKEELMRFQEQAFELSRSSD